MDEKEVRKIIRDETSGILLLLAISIALVLIAIVIAASYENSRHQELKARIEQLEANPGTSR